MVLTDLPGNVMANDILLRLPVKSLVQCSFVNKSLCNQISNPHFIDMHLNEISANKNRYIILKHLSDFDESEYYSLYCGETFIQLMELEIPLGQSTKNFEVAGSCNGLLLLLCPKSPESGCSLHIWNPIIRQVKHLPDALVPHSDSAAHVVYGFGFLPTLKDYRVVRIMYSEKLNPECLPKCPPAVEIYSLVTDSWKRIETTVPYFLINCISKAFLKGSAYWLARKKIDDNSSRDFIVSFDMVNEVFQEIMLPDCCIDEGSWLTGSFTVFGESFHLFVHGPTNHDWSVWVMHEKGSVKSWSKQFTIEDPEDICWPLCFMDNGQVLFVNIDGVLALYDPKIQRMANLELDGDPETLDAIPYTESLVLLDRKNRAMIEHYDVDIHDNNNNEEPDLKQDVKRKRVHSA